MAQISADQLEISGLEHLPKTETDEKDRLVAFGGFVKPEIYFEGIFDPDLLSEEQKNWMRPENIAPFLFSQNRDEELVYNGIKLNSREHKLVARYPARLAEEAMKGVLKDKDLTEQAMAAQHRARVHILESKQEGMLKHTEKLAERKTDIEKLLKEIRTPGFAHVHASEMRLLINHTYQEFINILDVLHVKLDWSDQSRAAAETALVNYLTQGSQRDRVSHWRQMTELARNYLLARTTAFKKSIKLVELQLEKENA